MVKAFSAIFVFCSVVNILLGVLLLTIQNPDQTGLVDVETCVDEQLVAEIRLVHNPDHTDENFPKDEILIEGILHHIVTEIRTEDILQCPPASVAGEGLPKGVSDLFGLDGILCHSP
jgi:hypothetical protein